MSVYQWLVLAGFSFFLISAFSMIVGVLFAKEAVDPAPAKGNIPEAIFYSFTGAMSPKKKESAFKHLPTYTAGMIFHIGTFLALLWLVFLFFNLNIIFWIKWVSVAFLVISALCGIGILIKRLVLVKLRSFSNPDDYFSNLLVTGFQIVCLFSMINSLFINLLFVYSALLFIYIPVGKLRHSVYFFTTRIYLAKFYGKRGVWPVKKQES